MQTIDEFEHGQSDVSINDANNRDEFHMHWENH